MGLRSWLNLSVLIAIALCSCSSPGKPFTYKDLKVSFGPSATPTQPAVGQATTLGFTLRNTWNKPFTGVAWQLVETTSGSTIVGSGTTDIAAFGSSGQSVVIASPTKGTHTYQVVVDPANAVVEADETNNTSGTLTVLVADQDLAFSGTPIVTLGTPTSTTNFTIDFTLSSTLNAAAASPGAAVTVPYTISRDGATVTPVSPASPLSVSVPGGTTGVPGTANVTLTMPPTGGVGTFIYTITLWPANDSNGDDSNVGNNIIDVAVVVPAPG